MYKAVIFDLDGTILDTNELIIASFLHTLKGETEPELTREDVIANFGRTLADQIKEFTGRQDIEGFVASYRRFQMEQHDTLIRDFPYVGDVLQELKRRGIKLAVVTSKIRKTSLMGLDRYKLTELMETIVTVEDVASPKPDPEGIMKALTQMEVDPAEALMVGDSQYDILAARSAGVSAAAVSWTAKGEQFVEQFTPDYMLRDMRELLEICTV